MRDNQSGAWLDAKRVAEAARAAVRRIEHKRQELHTAARAKHTRWWHGEYEGSLEHQCNSIGYEFSLRTAVDLAALADATQEPKVFVTAEDFRVLRHTWSETHNP